MLFIGNKATVLQGRGFNPFTPTDLSDVSFTPALLKVLRNAVQQGLVSPIDKEGLDLLGMSETNNAQFSLPSTGSASAKYWGAIPNLAGLVALAAKRTDWAIRVDTGTTWILTTDDPTLIANWIELPKGGSISVTPMIDQAYGYATPTNGFSVTVPTGVTDYQIHAAGTLATGTVRLPALAGLVDGLELTIGTSFAITALTLSLNGGAFANPAALPTTLAAGGVTRWKWYGAGVNLWVRRG